MGRHGSLRLAVELQPSLVPACMIKLSPAVLDALRSATGSGKDISIRFHDPSQNNVRGGVRCRQYRREGLQV